MRVVGNESDRTLRLSSSGVGGCPASSQNASVLRTDGQTVKLMGCKVGDARVRLFSQSDDRRLRTYNFRVLAPPPTPTLTPNTCTTTDIGVLRFLDPRPEYRFDGRWEAACNGSRPAKLFTFTLPDLASPYVDSKGNRKLYYHEHHVVIDLTSTSGLDPRLILQGQGESTDNPESSSSTGHARLGRTLTAGTYTIEATLTNLSRIDPDAEMALIVRVEQALRRRDTQHQPDHTAVFYIDSGFESNPILRKMFLDEIENAKNAWNNVARDSWPFVEICENDCAGNLDGLNMAVKTSSTTACRGIACVERSTLIGQDGEHVYYPAQMTIESPAVTYQGVIYRWTNDASLHGREVPNGIADYYFHLPSTVVHEFGHVLGLDDLYSDTHGDLFEPYKYYLMGTNENLVTSVPETDIRYLKQVYRDHGGRPHR